ncbi:MAG: hypothetical protein FJW20_15015 [Acidimicrobiia bacterium]|nr:hypothetical protein [Acidimicrobiia bacterium]
MTSDLLYHLRRSFLVNLPLAAAALIWRRLLWRTTFIAITGSNGKTTTKEILARILSARHRTLKTEGNANGRAGLIRTILRVRPWHRFAVIEVGIEAPGQMWRAALLTRPDIAVITSIAAEHSENFPTLEVTAKEKSDLLGGLGKDGVAVLNGDDPRVRAMANRGKFRLVYFGNSREWDLWAEHVEGDWPQRLRMQVRSGGGRMGIR